jgi:hypothetical protein
MFSNLISVFVYLNSLLRFLKSVVSVLKPPTKDLALRTEDWITCYLVRHTADLKSNDWHGKTEVRGRHVYFEELLINDH